MKISLKPSSESAKDVLTVTGISKSFGSEQLFSNISFEIKKGEHVAIIGDNGTGKTTMLKIIRGIVEQDAGTVKEGSRVCIGYYDQEQQNFDESNTVFEEISDTYPGMSNTEIRSILASFLFTGDDVFKVISSLSGGERGRLSLVKLMLSEANFLLLDEPTNHLDITSKEILEEALRNYAGTVFYVSHDRYFVEKTATRILELTHETILSYAGNYSYYLEQKEHAENAAFGTDVPKSSGSASAPETESKLDWREQKEAQARKRKLQNRINQLEQTVERLESRITEIDELMASPEICTNSLRLNELGKERESAEEELLSAMTEWEEIQSKTE
jgi:ATP-binding cassette subfamily F protein 3